MFIQFDNAHFLYMMKDHKEYDYDPLLVPVIIS